jgi:hypothetical protein
MPCRNRFNIYNAILFPQYGVLVLYSHISKPKSKWLKLWAMELLMLHTNPQKAVK